MLKLSDRFFRALCLCTGECNVKTRLTEAWINYLDDVPAVRLPDSVQADFLNIRNAMHTTETMPDEHPARAAVRKMSAGDASEHIRSIAAIFRELLINETVNETVSAAQPELTPQPEPADIAFTPEHDPQFN